MPTPSARTRLTSLMMSFTHRRNANSFDIGQISQQPRKRQADRFHVIVPDPLDSPLDFASSGIAGVADAAFLTFGTEPTDLI